MSAVVSFGAKMFCPLCKAEYRQEFTTCSDCRIGLVATQQEAFDIKVERLSSGDDAQSLDVFLNTLADAQIPFRSREVLRSSPWPWISLFFFRYMKPKPASEYWVDVFERDAERARTILQKITEQDSLDDENEEDNPGKA